METCRSHRESKIIFAEYGVKSECFTLQVCVCTATQTLQDAQIAVQK